MQNFANEVQVQIEDGFRDEETAAAGQREHVQQRGFGSHCRCELCVQPGG